MDGMTQSYFIMEWSQRAFHAALTPAGQRHLVLHAQQANMSKHAARSSGCPLSDVLSENGWHDTILLHHGVEPAFHAASTQAGQLHLVYRAQQANMSKHAARSSGCPLSDVNEPWSQRAFHAASTPAGQLHLVYHAQQANMSKHAARSSGCPLSDVSEPCWPQRKWMA